MNLGSGEKCVNSKCLQKEQYFEWYRQGLHKQIDKMKLENEKEKEIDNKRWANLIRITVGKDMEMKKLHLENEELKRKNNQLESALNDHGKSGGSQGSGQNDSQTNETVKELYEEMNKSGSSKNQCENAQKCAEEKTETDSEIAVGASVIAKKSVVERAQNDIKETNKETDENVTKAKLKNDQKVEVAKKPTMITMIVSVSSIFLGFH